ncbi:unnamed protein product [Lymnaea stagnalis]|uniref:Kynurenine formamidase n=1 Tax=Lymnaea stagnalis TaxID=6523 RepID=A0AAV2HEX0_LYMST
MCVPICALYELELGMLPAETSVNVEVSRAGNNGFHKAFTIYDIALTMTVLLLPVWFLLFSSGSSKIIDLSHKHGPYTFMFPGQPAYNRTVIFTGEFIPGTGIMFDTGAYGTGEHGGTHLDAPSHFGVGGQKLDEVPIESTIADGVMIDCSAEAAADRNYQVTVQKILDWELEHGEIPMEAAVIFNFDWSKRFNNRTLYLNTELPDSKKFSFPSISEQAGIFLYEQRKTKIIGVDSLSPDPMALNGQRVRDLPLHMLFLPNNRIIVENLKSTELLPPRGFRFHTAPVKFVGGSGTPVRAFAVTYDGPTGGGGLTGGLLTAQWVVVLVMITLVELK